MESFNISSETAFGFLPNLTSSEDLQTNSFNGNTNSNSGQNYIDSNEANTYRCEGATNSSNITSFDEILRDIIETSKNHMSQTQHQSHLTSTETTFYHTNNTAEGSYGYYPSFSQPPNLYSSEYNSVEMNNLKTSNKISDNYEHIIETVYEDTSRKENFHVNISEADSTDARNCNDSNCLEILQKGNDYSQQNTLPPFNFFQAPYMNLQPTFQYTNQYMQTQPYAVPFSGITSSGISAYPLEYNKSNVKVFSPKILSLQGSSQVNLGNNTVDRNKRIFSNTMPPPFSVSSSSAFKTYRKKNQKHMVSNITLNSTEPIRARQDNNSRETIVLQPANVFVVSQESNRSSGPEWVIEKMYISSDSLSVRSPLQTKKLVEEAKETAADILFNVDFSSLDTSNIIIPNIQIKGPLHKKRKQEIKILEDCEGSNYKETLLETDANLPDQSSVHNLHSYDDKAINNSDIINSEEEIKTINPDRFNDNEVSEDSSLKNESLHINMCKCHICNKVFGSIYNLRRHNKNIHLHPSSTEKKIRNQNNNKIELITSPADYSDSTASNNSVDEQEKVEIDNNPPKKINKLLKGKRRYLNNSNRNIFQKDIPGITDKIIPDKEEKHDNKIGKRKKLNKPQIKEKCSSINEKRTTRSRIISYKE